MPELPEVETVVRSLTPHLVGKLIDDMVVYRPDVITAPSDFVALCVGKCVERIVRRGKRIIIHLGDGGRFYVHLGMTGRLSVEDPGVAPRPHTHVIWAVESKQIRFSDPRRFGGIWWVESPLLGDEGLGPEPLELRSSQLHHRVARTARAIKSVLLDQSVVAGLGNIYVDESLHRANIHPQASASSLDLIQVRQLNRAIKAVLKNAIRHRGSTLRDYRDADGNGGRFQDRHVVYDRAGHPCRRCGTLVARIVLGGRSTHFCPSCQPTTV